MTTKRRGSDDKRRAKKKAAPKKPLKKARKVLKKASSKKSLAKSIKKKPIKSRKARRLVVKPKAKPKGYGLGREKLIKMLGASVEQLPRQTKFGPKYLDVHVRFDSDIPPTVGELKAAIRNSVKRLEKDAVFYIRIYSAVTMDPEARERYKRSSGKLRIKIEEAEENEEEDFGKLFDEFGEVNVPIESTLQTMDASAFNKFGEEMIDNALEIVRENREYSIEGFTISVFR